MPRQYTTGTLYRRVFREAWPYRWHLLAILGLSLLSTPIMLLTPLPVTLVVDSVLGDAPPPPFLRALVPPSATVSAEARLALAAALSVAVVGLGKLCDLATSLLHTYTGAKLVLHFRARLFRHAQRLSIAYHDTNGGYDTTYRVQYDAPAIQWIAVDGVIPFVASSVTLIGMIVVTTRIHAALATVALVVAPVLYVLSHLYSRKLRRQWRGAKHLESAAFAIVQEVLEAVRVVKAFGREDHEEDRFVGSAAKSLRAELRLTLVEGSFGLLVALTTGVGAAAVLYLGAGLVQRGELSLGNLLLVLGYLAQLYRPLESMSQKVASLQASLTSAERAFALLDERPDVPERWYAKPLPRAAGAITFEHVSFSYDGQQPVLADVSFHVEPGARVGIAGTTGAGKTTLVSLLNRFYDPTSGWIRLDGLDLRRYRLVDLRNQFGIVLQEPVLFATSIGENIRYARPTASDAEVQAAARVANAHKFIEALPAGYDTIVGERGMRLSGGERQRIAIARAFLKDAPILILDEPTSALDVSTESAIMEAMERLMLGRTTFMIAHRLSTLEHCDMRLVIEHGHLVSLTDACGRATAITFAQKAGIWSAPESRPWPG